MESGGTARQPGGRLAIDRDAALPVVLLVVIALLVVVLVRRGLDDGEGPLQGLGFAPFRDCQSPDEGVFPTQEQIREDVELVATMGNAVRTYSTLNGGVEAATWAEEAGLRVSAGAWLGPEDTAEGWKANREELDALIALAEEVPLESVIVGNEVLLRKDLPIERLVAHIEYVKERVDVEVTTAEIAGILTLPENRPVVDAVDYALVHVYPYWDGIGIEEAAWYVADVYEQTKEEVGKPVVIGETGWPSGGPNHGAADATPENAEHFLEDWVAVADQEGIDYYYFAAFDENWKTEGGVGPHWGIWDAEREPRFERVSLLDPPLPVPPEPERLPEPLPGVPAGSGSDTGSSADRPGGLPQELVVYRDWPAPADYVPSGLMGDTGDITFDPCDPGGYGHIDLDLDQNTEAERRDRAIRIDYQPTTDDEEADGWAGMYWQNPEGNWGTEEDGGIDLTGVTELSFYAKGNRGGERIEFFAGGIAAGPYPDTLREQRVDVTLDREWQWYSIDLRRGDLSRVIGGFGWVATREDNPDGASFMLDEIVFGQGLAPLPPPREPCIDPPPEAEQGTLYILDGSQLCGQNSPVGNYEVVVDSSAHRTDWLKANDGVLQMEYPAGQDWGVVAITVGDPYPPGPWRQGQDLTRCRRLLVDLTAGSGTVSVGMKDTADFDDGGETKIPLTFRFSPGYDGSGPTKEFSLDRFFGLNLHQVYVVAEFVFEGPQPMSVSVSNIRLECDP